MNPVDASVLRNGKFDDADALVSLAPIAPRVVSVFFDATPYKCLIIRGELVVQGVGWRRHRACGHLC